MPEPLPQFRREYPPPCGRVTIAVEEYDPISDSRSVRVVQDGWPFEGYGATFHPDPDLREGYAVSLQGFVVVPDVSTERIMAAVEDILSKGGLLQAFDPPDPIEDK